MIRKNTYRFSAKIMLHHGMIRKSGYRFSEKIMRHLKARLEEPRAPGSLERESRGPFAHRESVGRDS